MQQTNHLGPKIKLSFVRYDRNFVITELTIIVYEEMQFNIINKLFRATLLQFIITRNERMLTMLECLLALPGIPGALLFTIGDLM